MVGSIVRSCQPAAHQVIIGGPGALRPLIVLLGIVAQLLIGNFQGTTPQYRSPVPHPTQGDDLRFLLGIHRTPQGHG